jgi:hypothetical protein
LLLRHLRKAQVENDLREGGADLPVANRVVKHVNLLRLHLIALLNYVFQEGYGLRENFSSTVDKVILGLF